MNLLDARRYLDSGKAINRVADKLRVAINYSMEAWLIKHGHTLNFGNGWHSMKVQFEHAAPEELRLKGYECSSKATSLGWQLDGGIDKEYEYPPWSLERWTKDAYSCITDIEEFVRFIKSEL